MYTRHVVAREDWESLRILLLRRCFMAVLWVNRTVLLSGLTRTIQAHARVMSCSVHSRSR
jgi:hypothetical protein